MTCSFVYKKENFIFFPSHLYNQNFQAIQVSQHFLLACLVSPSLLTLIFLKQLVAVSALPIISGISKPLVMLTHSLMVRQSFVFFYHWSSFHPSDSLICLEVNEKIAILSEWIWENVVRIVLFTNASQSNHLCDTDPSEMPSAPFLPEINLRDTLCCLKHSKVQIIYPHFYTDELKGWIQS